MRKITLLRLYAFVTKPNLCFASEIWVMWKNDKKEEQRACNESSEINSFNRRNASEEIRNKQ